MIIATAALVLLVVLAVPIYAWRKRGANLCSPIVLASFMIILTEVPYLLALAADDTIPSPAIRHSIPDHHFEWLVCYFVFLQIVGYLFLYLGMRSRLPRLLVQPLPVIETQSNRWQSYACVIVFFLIGFFAYKRYLASIGGLGVLMANLSSRTFLSAGQGYLTSLIVLMALAVYVYIYTFRQSRSLWKYLVLVALIVFVAATNSSFGSRRPTLELLAFSFLVWHFGVSRLKQIPIRALLLVPLVIIYIVAVPIVRSPGSLAYFSSNPEALMSDVGQRLGNVVEEVSYVSTYLYVVNRFSLDNLWLGRSFNDLLYAFIPSRFYPDKPPTDDGVYLTTMMDGTDVIPPVPYHSLYPSGYPPETLGLMFMNFWIPGVLLGMYLLGVIYQTAYQYMKKADYSLHSIIMYGIIIFNFHLTTLRISQAVRTSVVITLFLLLFMSTGALSRWLAGRRRPAGGSANSNQSNVDGLPA